MIPQPARRRRIDATALLLLASWSYVVTPRLVQSLTAPKYRTTVGAPVPFSAPASGVDLLSGYGLIALCLVIIGLRLGDLPTRRRRELLVLLAPWVYVVCRDLYVDTRPDRGVFLYPLLLIAFWVLRPDVDRLRLLGYLVGLTAVISLALGILLPAKGIYTSITGDLITPDKQILPGGVLIGVFTDSNNLGQFLVLGLPAVALVPRRLPRSLLLAATVYAIVWSSSRSSIIAAVVGTAAALMLVAVPLAGRRAAATIAILVAAATVGLLPLVTSSDTAFTNRGFIWRTSLSAWTDSPLLGLGSNWYSDISKFANSLGGLAYHGHNEFVQIMVTGGLVGLVLAIIMGGAAVAAAARWAGRRRLYPAVYLTTLLVSCCLEVSFGFVDRTFLLVVTVVPIGLFAFASDQPAAPGRPASTVQDDTQHASTHQV